MVVMINMIMREVGKRISELSREFYESLIPPIDMYEEGGELVVIADLAGFDKNKINVRITAQNDLIISAEREIQYIGTKYVLQRPKKIYKIIHFFQLQVVHPYLHVKQLQVLASLLLIHQLHQFWQ